jgi:SNF2 family DNA or RNA helicase
LIVLHAIWENTMPGKLHLWAETSSLPKATSKGSGTKKARQDQHPLLHPFALSNPLLLTTTLEDARLSTSLDRENGTLLLRLPSSAKGPQPSPELILESDDADTQPTEFTLWKVATLALTPKPALDFLLSLPGDPPHGIAFGSDLRFWIEAANFAFELITRQCYTPTFQEVQHDHTTQYRAAWETMLVGEDDQRTHLLSTLMPAACWSYLSPAERVSSLPQKLLLHFLNETIDAYVRASLAAVKLLPSRRTNRRTATATAVEEQWLQALATDDATLKASSQEIQDFSTKLHPWLGQLLPATNAAFRTCFQLDPPGANDKNGSTWQVRYYLQASDDRSLLIPAEKVWQERKSTLTFLKRQFENPQERLLADLGRASRLFPAIEDSLKTARPTDLRLTSEQAYTFLRQSVPLLEQSGFGVLVPSWWQKPTARLSVKLKVKSKTGSKTNGGIFTLQSIVEYNWSVSVGDTTLSDEEFMKLVNLKMPLIQVRGQWIELRPEEIEAAIKFFAGKKHIGEMELGEALRLGLGQEESELGLPINAIEGEGWIKELIDSLSDSVKITSILPPPSFKGKLRPYQLKGVSWLAFLKQFGFGACLADSMGLGKTIQLITLLLHDRELATKQGGPMPNPTLIICPMSIVGNWQKEIARFGPSLSVMVHHGSDRLTDKAFIDEAQKHDVVITTYALALRDQEHFAAIEWENIVLDEAQNIKNESAKQTKAIRSLNARHKIALTGTPVENRLSELWSIMEFLNPNYLGSGKDFSTKFATPIEKYHDKHRAETLKRLIQPFVLRRLKTDKTIIQDLPDKMEMNVFCNLTQEQASLYEGTVKEMMEQIENSEGIQRKGLVLSTILRLKQICNHPAQFVGDGSSLPGRSGKLARLEEMLTEALEAGDKALIFTQFAEMGTLLRHHLQETLGREVIFLHGGTSKKQRDAMVQRFQEDRNGAPIFILSLKAGGVGLNLTAANHVFHFDRWWNPAVENQATDRAFRIGQQKNVQVHKFVCIGTLEERIDQMIEQKKVLAESIVGSGENWLAEMSTSQLKELFALSREAVGE